MTIEKIVKKVELSQNNLKFGLKKWMDSTVENAL